MDKKEILKIVVFFVLVFGIIHGFFSYVNKALNLPNDNPMEQQIEEVIHEETDIVIDLTPNDDI